MQKTRVVVAAAVGCGLVATMGACGGGSKSSMTPPPDPVSMALQAPGVRTVVVPKQSTAITIVVPPCGSARLSQETTKPPPGSNQVVVPAGALDQTVAVQPCFEGAKNSRGANTVLLGPGGAGSPTNAQGQQQGQPKNQLVLPKNSHLARIIVPPCIVKSSSSSSSSGGSSSSGTAGGGLSTVLPATKGNSSVTAPPCEVSMTSSSSSS